MRTVESTAVNTSIDLDALVGVLREHPVQLAILFGSHATETTHSASDIDIAVEFNAEHPSDPSYNETFFELSADLSHTLGTDDVDLIDLHAASPALAAAVFENGVLLLGDQEHAATLCQQITAADTETQLPRERLEAALARMDVDLDRGGSRVPVSGESEDDG
jgi:predicted nucleotidyltransferase